MNDKQTTRRRFIVAALTFSAVAINLPGISWLKSSAAWAQSDDDSASPAMVRLARMLFPHAGMPDSTYREIMGTVLAALAANPDSAGLVGAAEQALDARLPPSRKYRARPSSRQYSGPCAGSSTPTRSFGRTSAIPVRQRNTVVTGTGASMTSTGCRETRDDEAI
jgi:hypothetical protein